MKNEEYIKEDIAHSFQNKVIDIIKNTLIKAKNEFDIKSISIVGGVSANKTLREAIEHSEELEDIDILFPKFEYCTDNAAMIAAAAFHSNKFKENIHVDAIDTKRNKKI